jgi:ketosteroid isomerase-like protein
MSERNVRAVQGVYERWSQGDFRASIDVLDPLVLLVMRPEFPDAGTYLGLDRLRDYTRGFLEPWTRITIAAEEIAEAGDSVVVAVRQSGTGSESGVATELSYFHVWSFRGGKAIRLEVFRERGDAFEAVGLLK